MSIISLVIFSASLHIQVFGDQCRTEPYPDNCHFPFHYLEGKYDECTKTDNWGVPWCSTDPDGDGDCDDCTWANCQESAPCVFPTTYQGESYYECIFIDNDGYPWCNITGGGWGNCDKSTCKIDYDTLDDGQEDLSR